MGLLINQGKQDTTQDNKFSVIVAKDVLAQIISIKLAKGQKDTLEVQCKILNGTYKGRMFFDRVCYDPASDFSWKYRALRKAAGKPYSETEAGRIDIEAILLNKAITVDLGSRKGKNKDGEEVEYQNVVYKASKSEPSATPEEDSLVPPPEAESSAPTTDDPLLDDDDNENPNKITDAEDWT